MQSTIVCFFAMVFSFAPPLAIQALLSFFVRCRFWHTADISTVHMLSFAFDLLLCASSSLRSIPLLVCVWVFFFSILAIVSKCSIVCISRSGTADSICTHKTKHKKKWWHYIYFAFNVFVIRVRDRETEWEQASGSKRVWGRAQKIIEKLVAIVVCFVFGFSFSHSLWFDFLAHKIA